MHVLFLCRGAFIFSTRICGGVVKYKCRAMVNVSDKRGRLPWEHIISSRSEENLAAAAGR